MGAVSSQGADASCSVPTPESLLLVWPENLLSCCRTAQQCPFHEALELIKGVGMFASKQQIANRLAFGTRDSRELAGLVAGIAALRQPIGGPVLQMHTVLSSLPRRLVGRARI